MAQEVKSGTFKPEVEAFGLASGVVRYVPNPGLDSLVPAALKARVKAAADSIAAGTLVAAPRPASMQASRTVWDWHSPQSHGGHREALELAASFSVPSLPLW